MNLMRCSSFFPPGLSASATSTASKELNGKRSTKAAGMVYVAPGLYLGNKQPGLTDLDLGKGCNLKGSYTI